MLDYMDRGGRGRNTYTGNFPGRAKTVCRWRPVRPIPKDDDFFENVWRGYRENGNVY